MNTPSQSVFQQSFDLVIFGAGYAGFAAARAARGRNVLLVDRQAAPLSESGWSFAAQTGTSDHPLWREWWTMLADRGGARDSLIDGAIAEVLASEVCRTQRLSMLYYATPVAVERCGDLLASVIVGTKAGLQRLVARQWLDATETGELAQLLDARWKPATPSAQFLNLYFRHANWAASEPGEIPAPGLRLTWNRSLWPNERRLSIELPGDWARPRRAWLPALRALHAERGAEVAEAVLTHGSVVPFTVCTGKTPAMLPVNVVQSESAATLAGRFDAGIGAWTDLHSRPQADGKTSDRPVELPAVVREEAAEVCVAGLGTGGACAALAAARHGAKVFGFDPLPFAGGIGAGGGIHYYYFGVKGGLQEEIDDRVREVMPFFGKQDQVLGFHPDAKKLVIETLLEEAGVRVQFGGSLCAVNRHGGRVTDAIMAAPGGAIRVRASAWVDATGDGDLAAFGGASFRLGRDGDGLLHAYTQSSGRAHDDKGKARMQMINYDSGFCDPTDSEDLTRARLVGLSHYVQAQYSASERPTYIAPAIGLRQGRQIETDYTLTLDDLIERRTFPDAVGYTGSHYDNHAKDFEFESTDAMFWVWICLQWRTNTACEIPYRLLLPCGLDNVWIACRAAGVSEEAHHSFRMQRDLQRLGEVAGLAAALACRQSLTSRNVPIATLRENLIASGALMLRETGEDGFGPRLAESEFQHAPSHLAEWIEQLRADESSLALWRLYRAGKTAEPAVTALLDNPDELISWRAAAILAMWGDRRAEARLQHAVATREAGEPDREIANEHQRWYYVPHWLPAISLLRLCGTAASLTVLEQLAADPQLPFNARTATALACAGIARRGGLDQDDGNRIVELLDRLLATPAPHTVRNAGAGMALTPEPASGPLPPTARTPALEDRAWQLHLAVARARRALGLPAHAGAALFQADSRLLVRRAFNTIQKG